MTKQEREAIQKLVDAATNAQGWLGEAHDGTHQRELADELRMALPAVKRLLRLKDEKRLEQLFQRDKELKRSVFREVGQDAFRVQYGGFLFDLTRDPGADAEKPWILFLHNPQSGQFFPEQHFRSLNEAQGSWGYCVSTWLKSQGG